MYFDFVAAALFFHPLKRDIPLPQLRSASELEDRLIDNRGKEPDEKKKRVRPTPPER